MFSIKPLAFNFYCSLLIINSINWMINLGFNKARTDFLFYSWFTVVAIEMLIQEPGDFLILYLHQLRLRCSTITRWFLSYRPGLHIHWQLFKKKKPRKLPYLILQIHMGMFYWFPYHILCFPHIYLHCTIIFPFNWVIEHQSTNSEVFTLNINLVQKYGFHLLKGVWVSLLHYSWWSSMSD